MADAAPIVGSLVPDEEINPWFVLLSPTRGQSPADLISALVADRARPVTVPNIDYTALRDAATAAAVNYLRENRARHHAKATTAERIFEVLGSRRYRAGTRVSGDFDANWPVWRPLLERAVAEGRPIAFTLPSFPFKIPNPVKVQRRSPDMAEALCLARLFEVTEAIALVHEPGAVWHVISDGLLYAPLCGVGADEADRYRADVRRMIEAMGVADRLLFVDMVQDVISADAGAFERTRRELAPRLRLWWDSTDDERRSYLVRNFTGNLDLRFEAAAMLNEMLVGVGDHDLDHSGRGRMAQVFSGVRRRAEEAAFEFTLTLYTLKLTNMVNRRFPGTIRATVHPKPGQWGLNLVNRSTSTFPWQGVALRKASGAWRVVSETEALRRGATPAHVAGDPFPFYYQEVDGTPPADLAADPA